MSSSKIRQRAKKGVILCTLLLAIMLFQSSGTNITTGKRVVEGGTPSKPASRPCCLLSSKRVLPWGMFPWVDYIFDPSEQLDHQYGAGTWSYVKRAEVNGLGYTCSVGFIDLGHVRHVADLTYYYYGWLKEATEPGDKLRTVGHDGVIEIARRLPTDDPNMLVQIARSIAYDESIFYEIETYWSKLPGQHNSAFSPEDMVSNLVGTYVGKQAIKYMQGRAVGFDTAVTKVLEKTLKHLGVLSAEQTRAALSRIDNVWFAGSSQSLDYLRRRNFRYDPVRPWRLEGVEGCADRTLFLEPVRSLPQDPHDYYAVEYKLPRIYTNTVLRNRLEISPGFRSITESAKPIYVSSKEFAHHLARIKVHARATYGPRFDQP
jgi:hypothetical protein